MNAFSERLKTSLITVATAGRTYCSGKMGIAWSEGYIQIGMVRKIELAPRYCIA